MFKGINCDSVKLEVHLEGKFPFQAPKVFLSTVFSFPSLADGRNLLQSIIKKPWAEDITVLEIANLFPSFMNENFSKLDVGGFQLSQCVSLKAWDRKEDMRLFQCQEIDPQNPKFFRDRALVITHSMILQIEVNNQYPGLGHLVCFASLFSLNTVKICKSDHEKITFEWRVPDSANPLAQQFKIKNLGEFIDLLTKNTQRLGVSLDRRVLRPAASISEEEVNAQALQRVKIKEINKSIVDYEIMIQDEMSKDRINQLIELYQKAIEYYSALSDPKFDSYLQKVKKLLSDEIVLDVLAGKPPPKKVEIKPAENQKVREFEDLEVWPSGPPGVMENTIKKDESVEEGEEEEAEEMEEVEKNNGEEISKKETIDYQGEVPEQVITEEKASEITEEKKEEEKAHEERKDIETEKVVTAETAETVETVEAVETMENALYGLFVESQVDKKKEGEVGGDSEGLSVDEILNEEN